MDVRVFFLVFAFVVGFSFQGEAQYKKRYQRGGTLFDIRYGVKLGYHMSNFNGDAFLAEIDSDNLAIQPEVEYKPLFSWHAGAYMDIRISELFIFQPEIIYGVYGSKMVRGADLDNPGQNFIVTPSSSPLRIIDVPIQKRLTTIQIPLIAKIGFDRSHYLNIGPVVSFKQKENIVYGDVPDSLIKILNFSGPSQFDQYKKLSFGAVIGYTFQMENGLNFNVRYNRNFTNINKNEQLPIRSEEPNNSMSAYLFSIGYTFQYEDRLRQNIGRRH